MQTKQKIFHHLLLNLKAECESQSISPSTLSESPKPKELKDFFNERETFLAEKYTELWKGKVEIGRTKLVKARIFYNLNLKVFALQRWKEFAKKAKNQKEILQKERAIEEDTIKKYLALKYMERNICLKIFQGWAMYSKIQTRKRKFEALNCRKETSKKKVDDFLNSLENISTTSNDWIRQKIRKEKEKPRPISYSVSLKRLVSKATNSNLNEGKEPQLPKIPLKESKQKTLKSIKGKVDETYVLQKEIINAQRQKMREQWKQIESLKEQKNRLVNHRPATDGQLVKKIERKILLETEDSLEEGREGAGDTTEVKSETAGSESTYSEDFEECSSEAPSSSVMARTPEMVRRVREREEVRAARREEIRRLHQERWKECTLDMGGGWVGATHQVGMSPTQAINIEIVANYWLAYRTYIALQILGLPHVKYLHLTISVKSIQRDKFSISPAY